MVERHMGLVVISHLTLVSCGNWMLMACAMVQQWTRGLKCQPAVSAQVQVSTILLLIHFPTIACKKAVEYAPSPCAPATHVGDPQEDPGCWLWTSPAPAIMATCRIKQQMEDLSFSLCLLFIFLCLFHRMINKETRWIKCGQSRKVSGVSVKWLCTAGHPLGELSVCQAWALGHSNSTVGSSQTGSTHGIQKMCEDTESLAFHVN